MTKHNLIGYDQDNRISYFDHLKASAWDASKITVACEADCSAGVIANLIAAGYQLGIQTLQQINPNSYTGNLRAVCKAAGAEILTAPKYLTSDDYLFRGDILLYDGHHVATNLDHGDKAGDDTLAVYAIGWHQDQTGWWYADTPNTYLHACWKTINGHWYYFGADGYIYTGWHEMSGKWYYFDDTKGGPLNGALWHESSDRTGALEIWYIN